MQLKFNSYSIKKSPNVIFVEFDNLMTKSIANAFPEKSWACASDKESHSSQLDIDFAAPASPEFLSWSWIDLGFATPTDNEMIYKKLSGDLIIDPALVFWDETNDILPAFICQACGLLANATMPQTIYLGYLFGRLRYIEKNTVESNWKIKIGYDSRENELIC